MSHDLDPLRTLYGEPTGSAPLDADGRAEIDQLAPIVEALGRLAPLSPPADAAAAVLAMARRDGADLGAPTTVRALYREGTPAEWAGADPAETEALAPVVAALDALPPARPDADTVAAVLATARRETAATDAAPVIDALYSEPASTPSASVQAEVDALRPVVEGLNALPPIAPPAETLATVLALAKGEGEAEKAEALVAVRALYDGSDVALDDRAQREADALQPIVAALDDLSALSPDADTVAAVLAMARRESEGVPQAEQPVVSALPAPRRAAPDRAAARPPANPSRRRFRIGLPVLGVLVAGIALVVALGPAAVAPTADSAAAEVADASASEQNLASEQSLEPQADLVPAPAAASPETVRLAAAAELTPAAIVAGATLADDPAAWEVTDDLPALALRVQALQAAGDLEWEDPPVALGSGAALDAASAPSSGWMQVRMQGSGR